MAFSSSKPAQIQVCEICYDSFPADQLLTANCYDSHSYCRGCLCAFFAEGTESLSKFPPECCGVQLYPHDYLHVLPDDIVRAYMRLLRDEALPTCATLTCDNRHIDTIYIHNDWALCEQCLQLTCLRCRQLQSAHPATTDANTSTSTNINTDPGTSTSDQNLSIHPTMRNCPPHVLDTTLERLATEQQWKQCPKCHIVVERTEGCSEITCRCKNEFCYNCGKNLQASAGGVSCECPDRS